MNIMETLPPYEARSFARWVARTVEAYFENPDVKKRFEEWQKSEAAENDSTALKGAQV